MTFLEAKRALAGLQGGTALPFLLGMSGTAEPLDIFIKGQAATKGYRAIPQYLPFGTLGQAVLSPPMEGKPEVWILFPWDLAPECDWRSGVVEIFLDVPDLVARAQRILDHLAKRPMARLIYIPAPVPPVSQSHVATRQLGSTLVTAAAHVGANILTPDIFSMVPYLSSGCPFSGDRLGEIGREVVDALLWPPGSAKVLVTDLDNTMWSGVAAEDGPDGINASPEGKGHSHFIYQTMLKHLKNRGVLIAALSRNDAFVVDDALASNGMKFGKSDFVAVKCGYGLKSDYLRDLSRELNIGLNSFVFVDDNELELAEVGTSLPMLRCLKFPANRERELPALIDQLSWLFERDVLTQEDVQRTELYRRRVQDWPHAVDSDEELKNFLAGLKMNLTIHARSEDNCDRALQLINKTNQFNLNGVKLDRSKLTSVLDGGGRLFTATLEDRTGSHGEIMACLINGGGTVVSWVMSCRVFQRSIEHAFLCWLAEYWRGPALSFAFQETERNRPIQLFLADAAFNPIAGGCSFDVDLFRERHSNAPIKVTSTVGGDFA